MNSHQTPKKIDWSQIFLIIGCGAVIWATVTYKWQRDECLAFSDNRTQFEECMK